MLERGGLRAAKMGFRGAIFSGGALLLGLVISERGFGQPAGQAGADLYKQHCAMCHDASAATHAPAPQALKQISPEIVVQALGAGGTMEVQGSSLNPDERRVLARYLTGKEFGGQLANAPKEAFCKAAGGPVSDKESDPHWNGWGVDPENSRFQPAKMAKLPATSVAKLKLKWAFAFPNAFAANAQPTIVSGRVFVPSTNRTIYSLDARTGCIHWAFEPTASSRSAIEIARPGPKGPLLAYFGDGRAYVYAINANSGQLVWKVNVESYPSARIEGAVKVYGGVVFVPLTVGEDGPAVDPKYECCKSSGALIALDAATGKQLWRTNTIQESPKQTGVNGIGTPTWGPSGAGVWSSPTLDVKRQLVYVTTGDNHSVPSSAMSDAVIAIDMKTGGIKWSRQFAIDDTFNVACLVPNRTNCPSPAGPDVDFGSSAVLVNLANGKSVLMAGQKSGVVHALDPDAQGAILWETRIGVGGLLGGIEWGIASDGTALYAPVSDIGFMDRKPGDSPTAILQHLDPAIGGGLFALNVQTGKKIWNAPPVPCQPGRTPCSPGQPAAITAIPGAVFSGAIDGHIRAYATENGSVLWDYDTERDYTGVAGLKGHGGSINGPGPVVVNGMLYVTSGYSSFGGAPGNMLLAFGVD